MEARDAKCLTEVPHAEGYVREELFSDGEPKRVIPQNRFPGETVSTPIEIPALFAIFSKMPRF